MVVPEGTIRKAHRADESYNTENPTGADPESSSGLGLYLWREKHAIPC